MPTNSVLQIDVKDNVMVALCDLKKSSVIVKDGFEIVLQNDINAKHKFFIKDMNAGDEVKMYGVLVGKTQSFIPAGGLMTSENIKHAADDYAYRQVKQDWNAPDISKYIEYGCN